MTEILIPEHSKCLYPYPHFAFPAFGHTAKMHTPKQITLQATARLSYHPKVQNNHHKSEEMSELVKTWGKSLNCQKSGNDH